MQKCNGRSFVTAQVGRACPRKACPRENGERGFTVHGSRFHGRCVLREGVDESSNGSTSALGLFVNTYLNIFKVLDLHAFQTVEPLNREPE